MGDPFCGGAVVENPSTGSSRGYRKLKTDDVALTPRGSYWGFTNPLTVRWFFSVIGSEYCHTYFWIAKDLAWMQSWRHFSIFWGVMALCWSLLILYHSLRTLNWHELWNFVALFLWLFANFWWMLGEAHDYEYPDAAPLAAVHTHSSARILQAALCWGLFYYLVILPFNLLPCSPLALVEYDDGSLTPRLPFFQNFRQYENLHMVFWIAKDLAWNQLHLGIWLGAMLFTIALAVDFIFISCSTATEDRTVDVVHFAVILIWVIGNSVWAYGDFFMQDFNEPMGMWTSAAEAFLTARWYASWILFCAIVPVFFMYGVWGSLTMLGKLQRADDEPTGVMNWEPVTTELDEMILSEDCRMCRDRGSSSEASLSSSVEMTRLESAEVLGSLRAASSLLMLVDLEPGNPRAAAISPASSVGDVTALVKVLQQSSVPSAVTGVVQRNTGPASMSAKAAGSTAPAPAPSLVPAPSTPPSADGLLSRIVRGLGLMARERSNDKVAVVPSALTMEVEELAAGLDADEFDDLLPHRD